MKKIIFLLSIVLISLSGYSQNTGSLPYKGVMLKKGSIASNDSCSVFDNASGKWMLVACPAIGAGKVTNAMMKARTVSALTPGTAITINDSSLFVKTWSLRDSVNTTFTLTNFVEGSTTYIEYSKIKTADVTFTFPTSTKIVSEGIIWGSNTVTLSSGSSGVFLISIMILNGNKYVTIKNFVP